MLYVQNTVGKDVSIVDEDGGYKIVGRISLGGTIRPDSVCASPDSRTLYVKGSPARDPEALREGPAERGRGVLTPFSTETNRELRRAEFRGHTGHMAISPDGRYVCSALYDTPHVP